MSQKMAKRRQFKSIFKMSQGTITRFSTSYGKVSAFTTCIDGHEYTTYLFKGKTAMVDGSPSKDEAVDFAAFVNYEKVAL